MKVKLLVTSKNYNLYRDFLKKYNYSETLTYSDWYERDFLHKERYRLEFVNAHIEVNSLEELFDLVKELPNNVHEIIINNSDEGSFIEIYDNYRET